MSDLGTLVVRKAVGKARASLAELVMAWARDIETGEPRYILELGSDRRGANCGCECVSCGLPLTAVNAGKAEFVRRPHFRHPEGAERAACKVLAARAAVLSTLQVEGWIELPRRRMSAQATGLSGERYDAWVELPPEKVRVTDCDFHDRTVAVLTLDDGRQLRVQLTGTAGVATAETGADGLPVPTILLDINDESVAAMAPSEIRGRLSLLPDSICWLGHWSDDGLRAQAESAALAESELYLDQVPDDITLPEGMDPGLKRETVLHHLAKRLIAEAKNVWAPGWEAIAEMRTPDGRTLRAHWTVQAHCLELDNICLETPFGQLIPDLTCRALPDLPTADYMNPLLIEVTVTNHLDERRLERLQNILGTGACLEIDLSRAGGRVTLDKLRALVIEEVATKRWVVHSERDSKQSELERGLAERLSKELAGAEQRRAQREERRLVALQTPLADVLIEYLNAVQATLDAFADDHPDDFDIPLVVGPAAVAVRQLRTAAEKMEFHGFPEASDPKLLGPQGVLSCVLCKRSANPSFVSAMKLRTSRLGNQRDGRGEHGSTADGALPGAGGGVSGLGAHGQGMGRGERHSDARDRELVRPFAALAGTA